MPSLSHAQTLGFAADVLKALEAEAETLRAIGIDPVAFRKDLEAVYRKTADLNARQESLKRETVATTAEYRENITDLYTRASGALDVLVAAVKKNSDAAKNFRQLRSRIKRRRKPSDGADYGQPPSRGSD